MHSEKYLLIPPCACSHIAVQHFHPCITMVLESSSFNASSQPYKLLSQSIFMGPFNDDPSNVKIVSLDFLYSSSPLLVPTLGNRVYIAKLTLKGLAATPIPGYQGTNLNATGNATFGNSTQASTALQFPAIGKTKG